MLQKIRERTTGWVTTIVIGLLMIPFLFVIDQSYWGGIGANNIAQVKAPPGWWKSAPSWWPVSMFWARDEITLDQFNTRLNLVRQQQQRMLGDAYDPREFASEENKRQILDQMIDERILQMVATQAGVTVSDRAVQEYIARIPQLQREGRFAPDLYAAFLQRQGMNAQMFETDIRNELLQSVIASGMAESAFVSRKELDDLLTLMRETRDIQFGLLPHPEKDTAPVEDATVQQWYDAHHQDFMTPETVSIEYIEVRADDLSISDPDEAALRERYEKEKARFGQQEQRLASHILVRLDANADEATQKAAEEKAAELAAEAKKPDADFAALAAANSDDSSKTSGGDLGWLEPGITVQPFEEALYSMQVGEISDPVKSQFGYHVIQLRDIKPAEETPFEEVRDQLFEEQLAADRQLAYHDILSKLTDAVIDNPSVLSTASEMTSLPVQRAGPFSRTTAEGILADPIVLRTAFSESLIQDGTASDPVELRGDQDHSVVLRVLDHTPEQLPPLDQIRDRVIAAIRADRDDQAAATQAEQLLTQLNKGEVTLEDLGKEYAFRVETLSELPRGIMLPAPGVNPVVFSVEPPENADTPSYGKAKSTEDGRYALFAVTKVSPGNLEEVSEQERDTIRQQFAQTRGYAASMALLQHLRTQFTVQIQESQLQSQQ